MNRDPLDEAIDREVASMLNVEPSPGFAAGVRQRIAETPGGSGWSAWWLLPSAAAVVALAIVVVLPRDGQEIAPAQPAAPRATAGAGANPPASPAATPGGATAAADRVEARPRVRSTPPVPAASIERGDSPRSHALGETLFSASERAALMGLFASISRGEFDLSALPQPGAGATEPVPIPADEIVIPPIVMEPLAFAGATGEEVFE